MGSKFKQKRQFSKENGPASRKDFRKQLRKEKKAKRNDYFKNKKKLALLKTSLVDTAKERVNQNNQKTKAVMTSKKPAGINNSKEMKQQPSVLEQQNKLHRQEMKEKAKLEKGIIKQRKKMLLEANEGEDKEIKKLEKQLKLNKRKSKSLPKSFVDEGLDWLLEVCDNDKLKEVANVEMNLQESGSEFEDDFALITGKEKRKSNHKEQSSVKKKKTVGSKSRNNSDDESENPTSLQEKTALKSQSEERDTDNEMDGNDDGSDIGNYSESAESDETNDIESEGDSKEDVEESEDEGNESGEDEKGSDVEEMDDDNNEAKSSTEGSSDKKKSNGLWEDIYGRLRDKKGNVVQAQEKDKYIPPHLRAKQLGEDAKKAEELARLRRQLKGLINRLAESNMHSIANQIDELYMRNSRNDMNDSLLSLLSEALVARVLTPERLVMEHTMLITVLHANVGLEVGAHFLQSFVQRFDTMFKEVQDVENKELDNVILIICHLYNFKVFHSVLMYNILEQLTERFTEKEVELILLVLRSVGFSLRKDDPLALKDLVLRLQKKAGESAYLRDNPRVRFMLDTLMAVKNNNVAKIPQYDPSYSEHLKKLLKTMVHKGKYVTELKVTLEDLLKAEERGRWWIVGSAWSGTPTAPTSDSQSVVAAPSSQFSERVLELARKQRMNTDTRRNIFCILVTAEDYLDAFEKLLRLGLKAQQEQEIIHVMMHCLMQEKTFNPYYAHLATHFCQADRKHQMTIQYHLWDKLKELSNMSQSQIRNLAKFLAHLFLEKALPISVLKVMQFSEMDKPCVRLLRQVLLSVLLSDSIETVAAVFSRVSRSEKLHMFRESLRLFLHHFVLRNATDLPADQAQTLKERVKLAETALVTNENKLKFF